MKLTTTLYVFLGIATLSSTVVNGDMNEHVAKKSKVSKKSKAPKNDNNEMGPQDPHDPSYGPYDSFQNFTSSLGKAFPDLTAISINHRFDDPLSVSQELLGQRLQETTASFGKLTSLVTLGSVTKQANEWIGMAQAGFPVHLESPDQFYKFYMSPSQIEENAEAIAEKSKVFADTAAAENDFYEDLQSNPAFNLPSIVVRVTDEHNDKLNEVFGEELAATFFDKGKYFFIDTTMVAWSAPHEQVGGVRYAVGTFVVLKNDRERGMIPMAVSVSMNLGNADGIVTKIFSKQSSEESRWRMALIAARTSATQWGVSTHIYTYHLVVGAVQRSMFNKLPTNHPYLQALLPFSKYTMQFNTLVMENFVTLNAFPFENDAPQLGNFMSLMKYWEIKAKSEMYYDMVPSKFLVKNGVDKNMCNEEWLLDSAKFQKKIESITSKFARDIVRKLGYRRDRKVKKSKKSARGIVRKLRYRRDNKVKNDEHLQAFFSDMVASNVKKPTSSGQMQTVEDLVEFLSTYLYLVSLHGSARMANINELSYTGKISSLMSANLVTDSEETTYTILDMMQMMPDTLTISNMQAFFSFFQVPSPYESISLTEEPYEDQEYKYGLNHIFTKYKRAMIRFMKETGATEDEQVSWHMNSES